MLAPVATGCEAGLDERASRRAITGPTTPSADPAVVALVSRTAVCGEARILACTATAVAPHALLTAAHCVAETSLASLVAITDDDIGTATTSLELVAAAVHPGYSGTGAEAGGDIALITVREELAALHPIRTAALDASAIGQSVRLIGYGADDQGEVGRELTGTAVIDGVDAETFSIVPGPAMSCGGDSGGPVFFEDQIAGVVSYGDGACALSGVNTRTDAVWIDFLAPTLADIAAAPSPPARAPLDRTTDYCVAACETDTDCPAAMACIDTAGGKRCALGGGDVGIVGDECTGDSDCDGVCISGLDDTSACYCFTRCDERAPDGCACSAGTGGGGAWLVLLAVGLVAMRRRWRWRVVLLALAACGDSGPIDSAPLFAEVALPSAATSVVLPDPDDVPCQGTSPEPCTVSTPSFGVGAAAADIDGDGLVDLYLAGPEGGLLLRNAGGAEVSLVTTEGLPDLTDYVHGAAFGDLDRDGDADLVLATPLGLRVLENDRSGVFSDRTADLVIAPPLDRALGRSVSVALGDLDYDGLLDIHLSEYGEPGTPTSTAGPGLLLLNRGGWVFEDLAAAWPGRHAWTSLIADIDRDGRLDLFIASETWAVEDDEQPTSLFFSDGLDAGGTLVLTEHLAITEQFARLSTPMGVTVGDPDGDGTLDLVVTLQGPDAYVQRPAGAAARDLEVRSYFGPLGVLDGFHTTWSPAFGDFDRDGADELLVTAGAPCLPADCEIIPPSQDPRLLEFEGGELGYANEVDVPAAGGLAGAEGEYRNARGLVLADLGGDGRDELLLTPFNDRFRLYRSAIEGGHYLRVELRGTVSAPTPVGAEIALTAGGRTQRKQLTSGGATHSSHGPGLLFELGDTELIDAIAVTWPSGVVQQVEPGAVDRTLVIDEPAVLVVPQRVVAAGGPAIEVWVQRVDARGEPLALDTVEGIELYSSDGVELAIEPIGGGRFRATRPPPDAPGLVRISLVLDGVPCAIQPVIRAD